jgi:hypothetical protein
MLAIVTVKQVEDSLPEGLKSLLSKHLLISKAEDIFWGAKLAKSCSYAGVTQAGDSLEVMFEYHKNRKGVIRLAE